MELDLARNGKILPAVKLYLLVHYDDSLYYAVRDRLRPIFMSAGTSVLGMLPLVVIPGRVAELYQELGIALTGGLALSTCLTPTVIPALVGLLQDFKLRKPPQENIAQQAGGAKTGIEKHI